MKKDEIIKVEDFLQGGTLNQFKRSLMAVTRSNIQPNIIALAALAILEELREIKGLLAASNGDHKLKRKK